MIWTVCEISILRLWNNKNELALAFLVPLLFFSIFALVFSRGMGLSVSGVRVAFVDDDQSHESIAVIRDACTHAEIKVVTGVGRTSAEWPIEKLSRILLTRKGVEVVVHIPLASPHRILMHQRSPFNYSTKVATQSVTVWCKPV